MTGGAGALRVARDTPTLRELTTEKLRNAIVHLHLKPGERLVERDLCLQTGVSRSCLREALRHLESEGLVERGAKGLFVAVLSPEEAAQIYEVRAALESAMARRFAERASSHELKMLETANAELARAGAGKATRAYVDALDRFFDVLLDGSGNEVARRILSTLRARITYLRTLTTEQAEPERRRETLRLADSIVDALRRRDGDAAVERCAAFVSRSAEFALAVLRKERG